MPRHQVTKPSHVGGEHHTALVCAIHGDLS